MEILLSQVLEKNEIPCEYVPLKGASVGLVEMYVEGPTYLKEFVYVNNHSVIDGMNVLELKSVVKLSNTQLCVNIDSYEIIEDDGEGRWRFYMEGRMYESYNFTPLQSLNPNDLSRVYIENGKYIENNGVDCYEDACNSNNYVNIDVPKWYRK